MNFKKKMIVSLGVILIVFGISIPTFAGNAYFSFDLRPDVNVGCAYSESNIKTDTDLYWYANPTSGNLTTSDVLYFSAYARGYKKSDWYQITSYGSRAYLYYTGENVYNRPYNLCGDTDRYQVKISGQWCP